MPFRSKRQRAYLYAKKPAIARKFARHSGSRIIPRKRKKGRK